MRAAEKDGAAESDGAAEKPGAALGSDLGSWNPENAGAAPASDLGTWNPEKAGAFEVPNDMDAAAAGMVLKLGKEGVPNAGTAFADTGAEMNGDDVWGGPKPGVGTGLTAALNPKAGDEVETRGVVPVAPNVGADHDPKAGPA